MIDLEWPKMLYRKGGAELLEGAGYAISIVKDAAEHAEAKAKGWFDHWHHARDDSEPVKSAMSRDDLETSAIALNVKFDGRTSDAKLAKLVAEARQAQGT